VRSRKRNLIESENRLPNKAPPTKYENCVFTDETRFRAGLQNTVSKNRPRCTSQQNHSVQHIAYGRRKTACSFGSVRNISRNKFSWVYFSLNFNHCYSVRVKAKNALSVLFVVRALHDKSVRHEHHVTASKKSKLRTSLTNLFDLWFDRLRTMKT